MEDTYETEYINKQFGVKNFGSTMMYGERYFIIDYIDDNNEVQSISDYYDGSNFRNYNIINIVDSDTTYLVYNKIVTKYLADIHITPQPTYTFHYYTLYWGDDVKIGGIDSEYREGRYPIEQVSIQNYP